MVDSMTSSDSPRCAKHPWCDTYVGMVNEVQVLFEDGARLVDLPKRVHYMTCGCEVRCIGCARWNTKHPSFIFWGIDVLRGMLPHNKGRQ